MSDSLTSSGLISVLLTPPWSVVRHVRWKKYHGRNAFARTWIPNRLIVGR
jgi:hypothetical protein